MYPKMTLAIDAAGGTENYKLAEISDKMFAQCEQILSKYSNDQINLIFANKEGSPEELKAIDQLRETDPELNMVGGVVFLLTQVE